MIETAVSPRPELAPPRTAQLVVVSNRLPFEVKREHGGSRLVPSAGGLVSALVPALEKRGSEGVWVGWSGVDQDGEKLALPAATGRMRYRAVPLSAREVSLYYGGFSNRTLWPLFHYFLSHTRFDTATWRAYERVNERFAAAAADESQDGSLIWVHDYQMMRVPAHIRRFAPRRRIAFFLHVPFPAADLFRVLPWARQLMRGLLAADLVAFHIPEYAAHFMRCAERLLGCEVDRAAGLVHFENRQVSVASSPISVDVTRLEQLADAAVAARPEERRGAGVQKILGVDRLDYTKGIAERIRAMERLLEKKPHYRGKIQLTQLMVPSREVVSEYADLKREIDELVGRVNGRFSTPSWSPIRYLFRAVEPEELALMYRAADVALVTPLRDGLNLVAKEFVASRTDGDGVLVLSEMAGASYELQEAIIVNPFDIDQVADALDRALAMPEDERRARMSALRGRVKSHDVHAWLKRMLDAAQAAGARDAPSPVAVVRRRLEHWLAERPRVALFLDFDGTLAPIAPTPGQALLDDAGREVVLSAARAQNVDVALVSGRCLDDLKAKVGVDGITYVGDHGFEIEGPGISYRHPAIERYREAMDRVAAELGALGVPGAIVERKTATIAYHVREVGEPAREVALRRALEIVRRRRLKHVFGKALLEVRPPADWHKGHAVLYVLSGRFGADWPATVRPVYIGDDATDEDAFRSLRGIGRTIFVTADGTGVSAADMVLPSTDDVRQLVRWVAAGGFAGATR